MSEVKKLAFHEIGSGSLFREVQSAFEQGQITAAEENGSVVVTLKICILPPEIDNGRFGHLRYAVGVKNPDKKSSVITTELRDNIIVSDGESIDELLQTSLQFPELSQTQKKEVGNGI
jgi:hypothetical protein